MEVTDIVRTQLLTAALPFLLTASRMAGVKRIALFGSLTTSKAAPKDLDLLLTVENDMDLAPLATAGRKLQGRVSTLTHGNFGADLFLSTPHHRYLGRLCQHKECPGFRRSCLALHCGARPYLRDDVQVVTLERALIVAPPLELWPQVVAHVVIPADVEQTLLTSLVHELNLERSTHIIPHSLRQRLCGSGTVNQVEIAVLEQAAFFLDVSLTEETASTLIALHPLERYASLLPMPQMHITGLWAVELAEKTCLIVQGKQDGRIVYIAR